MSDFEHPFAQYVRILGKGKTGSRSLSQDEAYAAMSMILRGEVEDVQLGAFLMLLRVKEESPEELAGFVQAVRHSISGVPTSLSVDIDWPSYAGKRSQLPWFVLSALLLAESGYQIFMHGTSGHTAGRLYTETIIAELELPIVHDFTDANTALKKDHFCFMPLSAFAPRLQQIIDLRNTFGLRSPVHTLIRLVNPCAAAHSFQSVFHPAYSDIHQRAAYLLGNAKTAVFKGESGEIERKPDALTTVKYCLDGNSFEEQWPRLQDQREKRQETLQTNELRTCWRRGDCSYGTSAIVGTVAIILRTLGAADSVTEAEKLAATLWDRRNRDRL